MRKFIIFVFGFLLFVFVGCYKNDDKLLTSDVILLGTSEYKYEPSPEEPEVINIGTDSNTQNRVETQDIILLDKKDYSKPEDNGSNEDIEDFIVDIEVADDFIPTNIYVNDSLDLVGKTLIAIFKSGKTETVLVTSDMISGVDTSTKGKKELKITYHNIIKTINYNVLEIVIESCEYVGTDLVFYVGEVPNFKDITFKVKYNNKTTSFVNLNEAEVENIDYELIDNFKYLKATYCKIEFNIPYTVSYRNIELNKDYQYINEYYPANYDRYINIIYDESLEIYTAVIYKIENNQRIIIDNIQIYNHTFNRFKGKLFINGFIDVEFHLENNSIYVKEI